MESLPAVYFETRQTQFMISSRQVPEYQYNILFTGLSHHQQYSTTSLTNHTIWCFSIIKTIRRKFPIIRPSRVAPIRYSLWIRYNCWKIIWRPDQIWSGLCFSFLVYKQCLRIRVNSPLLLSQHEIYDEPQRCVPQGLHKILSINGLPFCS